MGMRFRKIFGLGGVRLNLSKSGVSASLGVPGLHYNVPLISARNRRQRLTVGLPGSGLSYSQNIGAPTSIEHRPPPLPTESRMTPAKALGISLGCFVLGSVSLVVLFILIMSAMAANAGSTVQRDAPTTRFYTPDGRSAGTASTYGNTTRFYGPDGRSLGSATTAPRR
jgi:hypothetical protein